MAHIISVWIINMSGYLLNIVGDKLHATQAIDK